MGMLEDLMAQSGGLDLAAIGAKVGLTPEQVQAAASQLLPKIADPNVDNQVATDEVAASTGISSSVLASLVPSIVNAASSSQTSGEGGVLGSILSGIGGSVEGKGGWLGTITGFLDRDGDGNPINDVMGMIKR